MRAISAAVIALLLTASAQAATHKLMVLSVDGLDWRYIRDADKSGLKIPNVRNLLKRSQYADGVIGVWPTISIWPSHTAIITGARPDQSGILSNARGTLDPALSYWSVSKLKVQTLLAMCRGTGPDDGYCHLAGYHGRKNHLEPSRSVLAPQRRLDGFGGGAEIRHPLAWSTRFLRPIRHFPNSGLMTGTRTLATIFLLKHKP